MKVYLTGPSFTPAAVAALMETKAALEQAGFEITVLTFTDAQLALENETSAAARAIFAQRLAAMQPCDALVALLDGSQADDGTSLEIGLFHALLLADKRKVGIIGLMTDRRGIVRLPRGGGINYLTLGVILEQGQLCASVDETITALRAMDDQVLE